MALKSFRDANPYVIGTVSVLALAAGVAFAFAVGILHLFDDTYEVSAVFADAAGITSGDDVRVAGVKVGRVTEIEANRREGNVRVDMAVESGVELGPRTEAEVTLETLLGTKYVRLTGVVEEPLLEGGALIPIERTRVPFDVFELARVGTEAIEETDTERLDLLVEQLATVAEGRRDDFRKLFEGVEAVAGSVNDRREELRALLDNTEVITRTLAEKDQVLVRLLEQSRGVLEVLADRRTQLAAGLEGGDTLVTQLADLTAQFKATIDGILDTVHDVVAVVDRRQADLDRALAYLGPGALGLAQAVDHGPWADVFTFIGDQDPSTSEGAPDGGTG